MQRVTQTGVCCRTVLLALDQAGRFAKCLGANSRFTDVTIETSPRAKSDRKYFVQYQPSNPVRQEAMVQGQQDARAERATTQEFTFALDPDGAFVWCLSHSSGGVYEVTPETCTCPDHQFNLRGTAIKCKHRLALEAALRAGTVASFVTIPAAPVQPEAPAAVPRFRSTERWQRAERDRVALFG